MAIILKSSRFAFCKHFAERPEVSVPVLIATRKCSTGNSGPLGILERKLKSGQLLRDEEQYKVAESLEAVFGAVRDYRPPKSDAFGKWFSKKKRLPKGLYIHGAVGKISLKNSL